MWLCHKEPSSLYGWTETKSILSLFSVVPRGSMGAVGGLSKAREMALLLCGLGHHVLPSAWCCITFPGEGVCFLGICEGWVSKTAVCWTMGYQTW